MTTDAKAAISAWAKSPFGAMIILVIIMLIALLLVVGVIRPGDFRGDGVSAERALVSEKEAMKLYIDQAARAAAEQVVSKSDEKWQIRWDKMEEDMADLKRMARWGNGLRPESAGANRSVQ